MEVTMGIAVRDVAMSDLEQVAGLWERAWQSSGRRKASVPLALSLDRLRRRVEAAAGGGFRFLAAWDGDTVTGIATVSLTDGGPLMDAPGVHIHVLHVDDAHRDRGVGTALLREVTDWANSMGSDQIVVDIPPASRQVARWYAGWGFGPYLHRRVATTAGIRRRLGGRSSVRVPGGHRMGALTGLRRAGGR
jgi:GNAT superfamily N-acetyltransferase